MSAGVAMPWILYGTAWKEERTAELVRMALAQGFTGIDTANQRKHYHEAGVGEGLREAGVPREQLFLQTKFTYQRGQDHRLPFDPRAPLAQQVRQSFASSLEHLGVQRIDSYVLHGPESGRGLTAGDREVWRAMEALQREGGVGMVGVSNIAPDQLLALCEVAEVAPAVVQNRCFARDGWDREVRAICRERGILYQGFSLLTANVRELAAPEVGAIARRLRATIPQVVFAFARAVGMNPLTGTTSETHMQQDLAAVDLVLEPAEIDRLERIAG